MSSTPASSEPKVNPSNGPPNTTTTSDVATAANTSASTDDGANVGASSTTSEDGAVDSTVSENDAATTVNANEDQQSNQNSEQQNNEGDEDQAQQQHDQQQQQHHQQQMEMGHPHPHMQGGMMPYGMVNGDMEQYDQETLMALSNQMMLHPHRGDHDGMNGGVVNPPPMMPGMNGNVEICRAYLAGRCSRGGACRFVHVENGSGHQPPNPHLCRDWLNGTCIRGTNCRFQHQGVSGSKASIHNGVSKPGNWAGPGGKIIICHQWASRGRCDYGTACKFAHHQRMGGDRWNESALDEKKLLAAMLSGLTPQEALSQALNSIQNNNPQKFGGPVPPANPQGAVDPNSPSQQAGGPQDPQVFNAMAAMGAGPQLVPPQKRADGSLILCRFFARHGFCKYGVACKFHHQPIVPGQGGMFPPSPYVRDPAMMGGAPNQSLASLLALGLKASMMSNDHLIANHAALLAASMNQPGVPPRMNSPGPMGGQPIDPQLANVLAAYLQQQQHPSHNANIAALLQQLQGGGAAAGGPPGNGSISPTQLQGFDAFTGGAHSQGQDVAFQAFLQQQHHQQVAQQNAFQNAFSPAAASAFNAIPNLNTPTQAASGPNAPQPNGLSLPQMISTAFRSNNTNGAPASSTANGGSSLSNNLSLMSLKPFSDDGGSPSSFEPASGTNTVSGSSSGSTGHARSNSSSFDASGSSLLGGDQRNSYEFGQTSSTSATNNSQIIGPSSLNNGSPNSSSLSALFSSSLNGPFLH